MLLQSNLDFKSGLGQFASLTEFADAEGMRHSAWVMTFLRHGFSSASVLS